MVLKVRLEDVDCSLLVASAREGPRQERLNNRRLCVTQL
jgi:hypothetical protein